MTGPAFQQDLLQCFLLCFVLWACMFSEQDHRLFYFRIANTTVYAYFPQIRSRSSPKMQSFSPFFPLSEHISHLQVLSFLFFFFLYDFAVGFDTIQNEALGQNF